MNDENEIKFIADEMLGKLAKWLRTIGYDTVYYRDGTDSKLVQRALEENRIILTRDTELAERKLARNCIFIKSENVWEQFNQVVNELKLDTKSKLLTRCLICNVQIQSVEKESVNGLVPPYTYQTHDVFYRCPSCGKIYWSGTHKDNMIELISNLIS
ncbi:TPA: hypothetical protein ENX78_08845 [Candidatus Poribacteria bacterium]|nr:hypothetical protein [Candidatus Poribacteria bacterium]